ncbi:MAG TPA: ABC transporter permease [Candidatus Polarisedimenticolia bacterium]|jgi:peptide/nickel transport system permease protein|nr:ABC transporter permease [Candidatus Polarisedimenticolia bacterium]
MRRFGLLHRVMSTRAGAFGVLAVGLLLIVAVFAPVVALHNPNAIAPMDRLQGPSLAHFFGTDQLGRDLYSRVVYGTRIAVGVSVVVMSISLGIGILLGIVAAYAPRAIDQVIVSIFDIINSFPRLILALALVAVLGAGLTNVILLVSVVFIPQFGRVARAQTVAIRNSLYLEAEQVLGAQPWRILMHHVLPNIIGPIFVLASMNIPVVITIEAGLSFLGVGIRPPLASWGGLLHDGYTFLDQSPWLAVFSGLALMLATLGFTLLGEALRDAIDPKLRQSR